MSFLTDMSKSERRKRLLDLGLMEKGFLGLKKIERSYKPCFGCGKPTKAYRRMVGILGKGFGPACKDCASGAGKIDLSGLTVSAESCWPKSGVLT